MIIEIKKISELTPAPYNPRESTEKQESQLKQSLKKFGVVEPIIYNKQTGYIVGGHFRVRELQKLGYTEIECVIVDLSEEDEKELNIRLNANTGQWDWDELANNFELDDLNDWGLEVPNMKHELETEDDNFEEPENVETDIVLGDLFEIGEHRLLCGDSTDSDAVAKLMDGQKIGIIVTDPPYGIGIDGQKESKSKNPKHNRKHHENLGWDSERPATELFGYLLAQDVPTLIWGGNYFADLLPASRGWLYWSKGQSGLTMSDGELAWTNKDKVLREFTVNRGQLHGSVHPTQKPVKVISESIKYLESEGIIFDCFMGSGTTMVAANEVNRICYGIEMQPKYCQVIIDRMKKLDPTIKIKKNGVEI
jgi:hypothetical protein